MIKKKQQMKKTPDPFDDSANARLIHMGLLTPKGIVHDDAMRVFAGIFAGQFFDDLSDSFDDAKDIQAVFRTFSELWKKKASRQIYLSISIQYDCIRKPLPDPLWWLAGNMEVVETFVWLFMEQYEQLMRESGLLEFPGGGIAQ